MRFAQFFIAVFSLTAASLASAGMRIAPVLIELEPTKRDATINVTNTEDNTTGIVIELYEWTQTPTREIVTADEPSSAVRVFPPQMELNGLGDKKVARLLARDVAPGSYRLELREVSKVGGDGGMRTMFEASVPVFVGQGNGTARIVGEATRGAEGVLLILRNTGDRYAQVERIQLENGAVAEERGYRYILPGHSQQRIIRGLPSGPLSIILSTGDRFVVEIP